MIHFFHPIAYAMWVFFPVSNFLVLGWEVSIGLLRRELGNIDKVEILNIQLLPA